MAEKRYTAIFDAKDRVSPAVRSMTNTVSRARDEQGRFIKQIAEMDREQDRYNRTTRETTNNVERMRRALVGVGSGFATMGNRGMTAVRTLGSGLKGVVGTLTSLPALIAGAGAAFGAWKLGDAIIGGALRQEMNQTQLMGLAGDPQTGKALFDMIKTEASNSTFATSEYMGAAKSYMGFTNDPDQMKDYLELTKRLALYDPVQGIEGAAVALRAGLSGEIESLADRFEISRPTLYANGFSSKASSQVNFEAIMKTIEGQGLTSDAVIEFESTGMAQLQQFKNKSLDWLGQMGWGVVKEMKPFFNEVNKFFKSSDAKNFANDMSVWLGGSFKSGLAYIKDMNLTWGDFERVMAGTGDIFSGVGDSFAIMMGTFEGEKGKSPREQFEQFAESIEAGGKAIHDFNESFAPFVDGIRSFVEFTKGPSKGDGEGGKSKGAIMWARDALTGRGTDWHYKPDDNSGFNRQLGPLFDIFDMLNFNPSAGSSDRLRGSHRAGLSYVPYDGYVAELHKGEQVVPAQATGRNNGQVLVTGNTFHVRQESDIDAIGRALANELRLKGAI